MKQELRVWRRPRCCVSNHKPFGRVLERERENGILARAGVKPPIAEAGRPQRDSHFEMALTTTSKKDESIRIVLPQVFSNICMSYSQRKNTSVAEQHESVDLEYNFDVPNNMQKESSACGS